MLRTLFAASCAALLCTAPARADLAQLSATYDFNLENTVFTITNDSSATESLRLTTSFGPITTVNVGSVASGATATYSFNRINGGFVTDPASAGVPDSTTYQLSVGLNGGAYLFSSNVFSPLSNLTGADVDFLGNQCIGLAGGACGTSILLSGVVASVPEPVSATLLVASLGGLGLVRRRRA